MSEHSIIDICVKPIELCKLLKIANIFGGGGEAKNMISEGNVLVNNKVALFAVTLHVFVWAGFVWHPARPEGWWEIAKIEFQHTRICQ